MRHLFLAASVLFLFAGCAGDKQITETRIEPEPLRLKKSGSSGEFTFDSKTFSNVPNLNVTFTTKTRPLMVTIVPDGTGQRTAINNPAGHNISLRILRDNVEIAQWQTGLSGTAAEGSVGFPGNFHTIDDGGDAGPHQYQVQVMSPDGAKGLLLNVRLIVYEL